jgi:hypothetical protein
MTKRDLLIHEIEKAPEPLLDEVLDFFEFLKMKSARERMESALAGESSLRKDWLLPEEDEAWKNL